MLRRQRDSLLEGRLPAAERLFGQAVYEVEVDALEPGLTRPVIGLFRLVGGMDAVEHRQLVVVEGLDAEGDAVHAGGEQATQVVAVDCARVRLERDLCLRLKVEHLSHRTNNALNLLQRQQ